MTFKDIFKQHYKIDFNELEKKQIKVFLYYKQMMDRTGKLNNLFLLSIFFNGKQYEVYDLNKIGQQIEKHQQVEDDIILYLEKLRKTSAHNLELVDEINKAYSIIEKITLEKSISNHNKIKIVKENQKI